MCHITTTCGSCFEKSKQSRAGVDAPMYIRLTLSTEIKRIIISDHTMRNLKMSVHKLPQKTGIFHESTRKAQFFCSAFIQENVNLH
jgi:hypothetical protein